MSMHLAAKSSMDSLVAWKSKEYSFSLWRRSALWRLSLYDCFRIARYANPFPLTSVFDIINFSAFPAIDVRSWA